MPKKNKKKKSKINFITLILFFMILSAVSFTPRLAEAKSNGSVTITQTVTVNHKSEVKSLRKDYLASIRKIEADYRSARSTAKNKMNAALSNTNDKGNKLEIKKEYNQDLKRAKDTEQESKTLAAKEFKDSLARL